MKYTTRILTSEELPQWQDLLRNSEQTTVFCSRWWMDWSTGKSWKVLGCFDKNRLVGAMPIWEVVILNQRTLKIPPFTQVWGPILRKKDSKYVKAQSEYTSVLRTLALAVSKWKDVKLTMHHSLDNWLPFKWAGFEESIRYTYSYEDLSDMESLFKETRENIKTDIRKSIKNGIRIIDDLPFEELVRISDLNFKRQGLDSKLRNSNTKKVCIASLEANKGKVFGAIDEQNRLHAAALLVWDDRCAYYLIGGGDKKLRNSGSTSLLIWEMIKFSSTVSDKFDFEGSNIEPVEKFFRAFGSQRKLYIMIESHSSMIVNMYYNLGRKIKKHQKI